MPGFFDPGHGFLSSFDEWMVALLAFVLLIVVGAVAEYVGDAKGVTVAGALVGYIIALFIWAPPVIATEWHYAVLIAVPIIIISYLYRGPGK
jgi:uncharacterized membrane protein YjjP (DUF1212 family)